MQGGMWPINRAGDPTMFYGIIVNVIDVPRKVGFVEAQQGSGLDICLFTKVPFKFQHSKTLKNRICGSALSRDFTGGWPGGHLFMTMVIG